MLKIYALAKYNGDEVELRLKELEDLKNLMITFKEVDFEYSVIDEEICDLDFTPEKKVNEMVYKEPSESSRAILDMGYGFEYVPSIGGLRKELFIEEGHVATVEIILSEDGCDGGLQARAEVWLEGKDYAYQEIFGGMRGLRVYLWMLSDIDSAYRAKCLDKYRTLANISYIIEAMRKG